MKGNCGECGRRWYCETNPDDCEEWPDPVPMTNADRIRSMSDEELAELLANETYRIAEPCFDAFGYGLEKQVIYAKRLEWLQQPAEKPKEDA